VVPPSNRVRSSLPQSKKEKKGGGEKKKKNLARVFLYAGELTASPAHPQAAENARKKGRKKRRKKKKKKKKGPGILELMQSRGAGEPDEDCAGRDEEKEKKKSASACLAWKDATKKIPKHYVDEPRRGRHGGSRKGRAKRGREKKEWGGPRASGQSMSVPTSEER